MTKRAFMRKARKISYSDNPMISKLIISFYIDKNLALFTYFSSIYVYYKDF